MSSILNISNIRDIFQESLKRTNDNYVTDRNQPRQIKTILDDLEEYFRSFIDDDTLERWKTLLLTDKPYTEGSLDLHSVPDDERDNIIKIHVLKELFLNHKIKEDDLSDEDLDSVNEEKIFFMQQPDTALALYDAHPEYHGGSRRSRSRRSRKSRKSRRSRKSKRNSYF